MDRALRSGIDARSRWSASMRRLVLALAAFSTAAMGQPPSATGSGEIIVEGRPLSRSDIAKVVHSISHPEPTGGFESQYPRWADRICVLVGGFPRDGAQFIADRIGEVARSLKLDAGPPGCSPNIFILATDNPAKLIAGLRLKRQGMVSGQDSAVIARIQQGHDAVRWLGSTTISGAFGAPMQDSAFNSNGHAAPQTSSYDGGSRLTARTQTFLTRETIVVDGNQIDGVSFGQLADYLAFVALAQLNPHAATPGVDSILSLFPRGNQAPAGLTAFDKAYLTALYRSDPNLVGTLQKDQIETSINGTLRPKNQPAAAASSVQPGH
jgi:hypothetical protein